MDPLDDTQKLAHTFHDLDHESIRHPAGHNQPTPPAEETQDETHSFERHEHQQS